MIMQSFLSRFQVLKSNGFTLRYALDIGAYRGDFTQTIRTVWPESKVWQIEADNRQAEFLDRGAIFATLGNLDGVEVDFYTLDSTKITTGSSIYKELTEHYTDSTTVVLKKTMTTVDQLAAKYRFDGNWRDHGLVKMDTQGSELLILEGAKGFLETRQPKYILLECSVQPYNSGAPSFFGVVQALDKFNYDTADVFDLQYDGRGRLLQIDLLFERRKQ